MIVLAEMFQDGMVIQRQKKWRVWGTSTEDATVDVRLNGDLIATAEIKSGKFEIVLPEQEAMENAVLEIGDIKFCNVDFGEVWIAGGQSNMEWFLSWDKEYEQTVLEPEDEHFRYFEVARYCFPEEKADGLKDDSKWNKWIHFCKDNSATFTAVGTYFALELRKKYNVPVAIIGCNWGGTSALAWLDRETILNNVRLRPVLEAYEKHVSEMDLEHYYKINYAFRASFSPFPVPDVEILTEPYAERGPRDANQPHGLYDMMLKHIIGYTARGVIWYQGENDVDISELYCELFAEMIGVWRKGWKDQLPFLYVQIAPFESFEQCRGDGFPAVRRQQDIARTVVEDIYMASSADCGEQFDIHPKEKRPVGHRLALLAAKHVYKEDILADAPEIAGVSREKDTIRLQFHHAKGLYIDGAQLNALKVLGDSQEITEYECCVEAEELVITSPHFENKQSIVLEFAQTPYYKVNLYNESRIPAIPFRAEC